MGAYGNQVEGNIKSILGDFNLDDINIKILDSTIVRGSKNTSDYVNSFIGKDNLNRLRRLLDVHKLLGASNQRFNMSKLGDPLESVKDIKIDTDYF